MTVMFVASIDVVLEFLFALSWTIHDSLVYC